LEVSSKHFIINSPTFVVIVIRPLKRKIDTKYKLPLLNWVALPPTKINETVFGEIDDENIYKSVDFTEFEESFKLKLQADSHAKGAALKGNVLHMNEFQMLFMYVE